MRDEDRTKEELIKELRELRSRVSACEQEGDAHKRLEAAGVDCDILLNNVGDLAYVCDDHGNILYVNNVFERLSGHPPSEFFGRSFAPLFSGQDLKVATDNYQRTLKGESPSYEIAFKDTGTVCAYRNVPFRDADGRIIGVLGIARDVTEERRAESDLLGMRQRLIDSEERYRTLIEQSPDNIIIHSLDGRILFTNASRVDILGGKTPEDIIGRNAMDFVHPDDREHVGGVIGRLLEDFEAGRFCVNTIEHRFVRLDGSIFQGEATGCPLVYNGELAMQVIVRDVTKRKTAERALAESRRKYRSLFENMLVGAAYHEVLYDDDGAPADIVFLEINKTYEKTTGVKRDDVIGKRASEVFPGLRNAKPDIVDVFGRVASTGNEATMEFFFEPLGRWYDVSAYSPEKGFFVATFYDVTERKKAEEELRRSRNELEEKVSERTAELERLNAVLQESESLYRSLVETIPYGIQEVDTKGVITFANPAHDRMLGFEPGATIGKNIADLVASDDEREALKPYFEMLIVDQPTPVPYYGTDITADGRLIDVKVDWTYKRNTDGELVGFISIITDITEQRRAEAESAARLHYVRSMNEINETFEEGIDLERMLTATLEKLLSIFGCDRAWLLYPVDLEAESFRVPYQVTTPEYPVDGIVEIPVKGDETALEVYRTALASKDPLTFDFDAAELPEGTVFTKMVEDFQIRSQMAIVLHPRIGSPWMLGMHQCSYARQWTDEEQRLFKDIAARVADALTGALLYNDLKESEEKYSSIFESSNDAIILCAEGRLIDCNQATLRVFGCSDKAEFIGRRPGEWSPPVQDDGRDSVEALNEMIAEALKKGGNIFEWTYRRKDGTDFPAEVLLTPMTIDGAEVLQATVRDITERKLAEEHRVRSYQVQRVIGSIMRSSLRPVSLTDVLEYALDAIVSAPFFSMMNKGAIFLAEDDGTLSLTAQRNLPESLQEVCASVPFGECLCGRAADTHKPVYVDRVDSKHSYRYAGIEPHGHYCIPILLGERVLGVINTYLPEGHAKSSEELEFLAMIADTLAGIIERKRAEEGLRLHSEMISNMTEGAALIRTDDAVIVHANPRFEEMFGYGPGELVGKNVSLLNAFLPDSLGPEEVKAMIIDALKLDGTWSGEVLNVRKDGSTFWGRATVSTYTSEQHGEVWLSIHEDITASKAAEEERERLEGQLVQSQKMEAIGTLAGGVAHDFNNIMTVIKNLTTLALWKIGDDPKLRECLEPVCEVSERAADLVQQLLVFSQSKPLVSEPVDINDTVEGLLVMLMSLVREDIKLETRLSDGLMEVEGDRSRIEQVLTNLIVNSRDAMPRGGSIAIATDNVHFGEKSKGLGEGASPGDYVRLVVRDTGTGMPPEVAEHIFEPFFTTKSPEGTGLGLSVVYGIVREIGGWIEVDTKPGAGTRIAVYFPAIEGTDAAEGEYSPSRQAINGDGRRILLVEDDKWVRRSTAMVLTENGYDVTEAENAEDAIRLFYREKGRFDLILSDVVMPGRSGLQMLSPILDLNPRMPVLLFSGHLDDKVELAEIIRRGIAYIQKPFEIPDLLCAVEDTIEAGREER